MPVKKYAFAFLINPISGGGLGSRVYNHLPEIMASFGYKSDSWVACLTTPDNLTGQVKELLTHSQKLVAVGGDGTIGYILNQLCFHDHKEIKIGLIPLGTGNDLGRVLGVYQVYHQKGLLACIKRLLRANSTKFDLWSVGGKFSLAAYLSIGMDAAILHDFDTARKKQVLPKSILLNKLFYLKGFFSRLSYKISSNLILTATYQGKDQSIPLEGYSCCLVNNINSYAGGSRPFPLSKFNDNQLDILLFKSPWRFLIHMVMSRVSPYLSALITNPSQLLPAQKVKFSKLDNEYIQIDGEDFTCKLKETSTEIKPAQKVHLLDLRQRPFNVF